MEEIARRALLFDFYGSLLTVLQQEVFDLYYQQDLSLGEIAEIQKVSRPAVHDLLRRTEEALHNYEQKLGLVQRYLEYCEILDDLEEELDRRARDFNEDNQDKLRNLLNKLREHW